MMTLPGYQAPPEAPPRRRGLAVASLLLGLVALPALVLFGFGVLLAVAGLVLGVVAVLRGRAGRAMAITGIVLSVLSLGVAGWLVAKAAECGRYHDEAGRRLCVEREFPFAWNI